MKNTILIFLIIFYLLISCDKRQNKSTDFNKRDVKADTAWITTSEEKNQDSLKLSLHYHSSLDQIDIGQNDKREIMFFYINQDVTKVELNEILDNQSIDESNLKGFRLKIGENKMDFAIPTDSLETDHITGLIQDFIELQDKNKYEKNKYYYSEIYINEKLKK